MKAGPKKELPLNVNGSSTFGRYPKISLEKTYNLFESDGWLVTLGGYQKVLQLFAAGEGRGIFQSIRGDFILFVVNNTVYRANPGVGATFITAPTVIGQMMTDHGEVFIDENLSGQICIVDGANAYIYQWGLPGANLTIQTGGNWGVGLIPNYVCFHDTFFLFGNGLRNAAGTQWYVYQAAGGANPTTLTYVSTQSFQTKPDYPLAVKRIPAQASNVIVFGTAVCEIQNHVGGTDNYLRNASVSIDYGCLSVTTIASNEEYIMWLGVNESSAPVIMIMSGQKAQPVSTDGIDYLMASLSHPEQSTALFYRQDGHLFYQITFYFMGDDTLPADNLTLLYDLTSKKFYHASDQYLNYHPARQAVFFNQMLYFVSLNNASLYQWASTITNIIEDTPNDPDSNVQIPLDPNLIYEMQRIRICQTIRAPKTTPFITNTIVVTIEQGLDPSPPVFPCLVLMITEDDYPDDPDTRIFSQNNVQICPEGGSTYDCMGVPYQPKVQLSVSWDGGETFSRYVDKFLNPLGQHRNILQWNRMGLSNEITPKFRFWGNGRFVVTDGVITILPTIHASGGLD